MMKINKIVIIISICILSLVIIIGGVYMFLFRKDNISRIEEKIEISLENKVSIVKEQRTVEYGEEHIKAKLLIEKGEIDSIKNEFDNSYSKELSEKSIIPNFKNTCSWWDMNEEYVISKYCKHISGKKVKTLEIWAFIVQEDNETYLYISY